MGDGEVGQPLNKELKLETALRREDEFAIILAESGTPEGLPVKDDHE